MEEDEDYEDEEDYEGVEEEGPDVHSHRPILIAPRPVRQQQQVGSAFEVFSKTITL